MSVILFFMGEFDMAIAPLFALCALNLASAGAYLVYARKARLSTLLYEALKVLGVLVIVMTARQFDVAISAYDVPLIDTESGLSLRNATIVCFIAACSVNIFNHWEKIGLPVPDKVKALFAAAREALGHVRRK